MMSGEVVNHFDLDVLGAAFSAERRGVRVLHPLDLVEFMDPFGQRLLKDAPHDKVEAAIEHAILRLEAAGFLTRVPAEPLTSPWARTRAWFRRRLTLVLKGGAK